MIIQLEKFSFFVDSSGLTAIWTNIALIPINPLIFERFLWSTLSPLDSSRKVSLFHLDSE